MGPLKLIFYQPQILRLEFLGATSQEDFQLEERTITPSAEEQIVTATTTHSAIRKVTVEPIPQDYGKVTWDGEKLVIR